MGTNGGRLHAQLVCDLFDFPAIESERDHIPSPRRHRGDHLQNRRSFFTPLHLSLCAVQGPCGNSLLMTTVTFQPPAVSLPFPPCVAHSSRPSPCKRIGEIFPLLIGVDHRLLRSVLGDLFLKTVNDQIPYEPGVVVPVELCKPLADPVGHFVHPSPDTQQPRPSSLAPHYLPPSPGPHSDDGRDKGRRHHGGHRVGSNVHSTDGAGHGTEKRHIVRVTPVTMPLRGRAIVIAIVLVLRHARLGALLPGIVQPLDPRRALTRRASLGWLPTVQAGVWRCGGFVA